MILKFNDRNVRVSEFYSFFTNNIAPHFKLHLWNHDAHSTGKLICML